MATPIEKIAHPAYLNAITDWRTIRDCYNGSTAVKNAGERYLPKLTNQTPDDYRKYLARALFFPITGKSASSLVGLATTKPPIVKYPKYMEGLFEDTTLSYQFTEFYTSIITEIVLMGRHGVLIDAPSNGSLDPRFVPYIAENVINWDHDPNTGELTMLLLREVLNVRGQDPNNLFESSQITRYRHCYLAGGKYYQQMLDDDMKPIGGPIEPVFQGLTIDYIPFVPFGSTGVHMNVDKPPMGEVATINVSHYLSSADLEWGRHIVGLPTPVVSGADVSSALHIGGTAAWILPVEGKAYFLEFTGQGLGSLEKALAEKISLMASVSARMMDTSTRGSEAAETVRLRYMSESASLIHIIIAVENGFNILYNMMARLMRQTEPVSIQFSREILGVGISFKDMAVLFEAYLNGQVSKETLLYNLKRLDAIDPTRTDEEELAAIMDPPPPTPAGQPGKPVGNKPATQA